VHLAPENHPSLQRVPKVQFATLALGGDRLSVFRLEKDRRAIANEKAHDRTYHSPANIHKRLTRGVPRRGGGGGNAWRVRGCGKGRIGDFISEGGERGTNGGHKMGRVSAIPDNMVAVPLGTEGKDHPRFEGYTTTRKETARANEKRCARHTRMNRTPWVNGGGEGEGTQNRSTATGGRVDLSILKLSSAHQNLGMLSIQLGKAFQSRGEGKKRGRGELFQDLVNQHGNR